MFCMALEFQHLSVTISVCEGQDLLFFSQGV